MRRTFTVAALLVALAFVFGPRAAQAQLGGVSLSAQGFGLQMTFDEPQAPVPSPTAQFELADSEATLGSGSAHALSSVAWPGPTVADGGPSFCPQYGVPFDCPAYPVRAEAFSPGKPHTSANHQFGPNTSMDAKASPTGARSAAAMQSSEQAKPAVVTGDYTSSSSTSMAGDHAVSRAAALVGDITIAGVVHVDSVKTYATAVTNGKDGAVTGRTVVSGVDVNGQAVTVDRKGVHVADQTAPVFDPIDNGQVRQALGQAGITLRVAAPEDSLHGATAERSLGGLVVTFRPGAFEDALPPQLGDQLKTYVSFDQTVSVSIGGVSVASDTLAGYGGYVPPPPPATSPGSVGGAGFGSGSGVTSGVSGSTSFGSGGGISLGSSGSGSADGGAMATAPVGAPLPFPPVKGIPAGLAIAALLATLAAGLGLKVLAERAVAAKASHCPLEELTR